MKKEPCILVKILEDLPTARSALNIMQSAAYASESSTIIVVDSLQTNTSAGVPDTPPRYAHNTSEEETVSAQQSSSTPIHYAGEKSIYDQLQEVGIEGQDVITLVDQLKPGNALLVVFTDSDKKSLAAQLLRNYPSSTAH